MPQVIDAARPWPSRAPPGRGKSSLLKLIYGTYRTTGGASACAMTGHWKDVATAAPHEVLDIRRKTIGYVTQFLRVIPRVPAEVIVAEPLLDRGIPPKTRRWSGPEICSPRLGIPERLWHLSPMTFSGGEQQRVNIARGFARTFPVLLLDEPTASLDPTNREARARSDRGSPCCGSAIIAVFHDDASAAPVPRHAA